jgi:hypothetical protein
VPAVPPLIVRVAAEAVPARLKASALATRIFFKFDIQISLKFLPGRRKPDEADTLNISTVTKLQMNLRQRMRAHHVLFLPTMMSKVWQTLA